MDKLLAEHGKDCRKEEHRGGGYLHTPDDNTPYDIDGVAYCEAGQEATAPVDGQWRVISRMDDYCV